MSDEERYSEEEEEEVEAVEAKEEKPKSRLITEPSVTSGGGDAVSEAEAAMKAAKKRHEEEEVEKLKEYEEQRRIQREKEEEELRLLKEKQERRRKEREEEEKQLNEKHREAEERRRQEEEERKNRLLADIAKRDEEKRKRQQMMLAGLAANAGGARNFVITKKDKQAEKFDKFGNIVQAKAEMSLTKEQVQERKKSFISELSKPVDVSTLDLMALRAKVKELHQKICKAEAEKYDFEKRLERQEYDLKELNERQRQINRNKAIKKGIDPDAANSRFPPKVAIVSKYDRQIDRRSFGERKNIFNKPNTRPHFPNCPPVPEELKMEVKQLEGEPEAETTEDATKKEETEEYDEEEEEEDEEEE